MSDFEASFERTESSISMPVLTTTQILESTRASAVRLMRTEDIPWDPIVDGFVPIIADAERFYHVHPEWAEEWLGIDSVDLRGVRWPELVHPHDAADSKGVAKDLESGELAGVKGFPNRYRRADGEWQTLLWFAYREQGTGLIYAGARPPNPEERENVDRILWGRDRCAECSDA